MEMRSDLTKILGLLYYTFLPDGGRHPLLGLEIVCLWLQRRGRRELLVAVAGDRGGRSEGGDGGAAHGGLPSRPARDVEEREAR